MLVNLNPFQGTSQAGQTQTYPNAANWWEQAGASGALAVYQPKGAASKNDSYTDLSGNGNDALKTIEPSWDATNGWTFNGSTQYISTGVSVDTSDSDVTLLIQFTGATTTSASITGIYGGATNRRLQLGPKSGTPTNTFFGNGSLLLVSGETPNGNLAIGGLRAYIDGVFQNSIASGLTSSLTLYIGCSNNNGTPGNYSNGSVQAFALYDNFIGTPVIYEVARRMAAL